VEAYPKPHPAQFMRASHGEGHLVADRSELLGSRAVQGCPGRTGPPLAATCPRPRARRKGRRSLAAAVVTPTAQSLDLFVGYGYNVIAAYEGPLTGMLRTLCVPNQRLMTLPGVV
jgi:hypothetical protein